MVFPLDKDNVKDKIKESDLIPKKRSAGYNYLYNKMTIHIDSLYDFNCENMINLDTEISKFWSKHMHYDKTITCHTFTIIMSLVGWIVFILSGHWTGVNLLHVVVAVFLTIALIAIVLFCVINIMNNIEADRLNYIQTAVYYHNDYKYKTSSNVKTKVMYDLLTNTIDQILAITEEDNKNG